jgi:hypothetical protein
MARETTRDEAHADIAKSEAANDRVFISDVETGQLTGMGATWRAKQRRLGKIRCVNVGNRKKDIAASVFALMHELVDAAYDEAGDTRIPVRQPPSMFKPKKRLPSARELAALARANERRHLEAVARREAEKAAAVADAPS